MVETIAPVVYGNKARYFFAVALHALTAAIAGALFGALLGLIGMVANAPWGDMGAVIIAVVALAYAGRELLGVPLPLFDRKKQVPDWWRTFYAPQVAAALYGAGLGIGYLTFLRFGTYVVVSVIAVVSGDLLVGVLMGAMFGLARGLTTVMSARSADEEEAASVVLTLERVAEGRLPRAVNGVALLLVAAIALGTSCDRPTTNTEPTGKSMFPDPAAAGSYGYKRPRVVGHVEDRRITESSGLVASRRYPVVLWTHNDSGDGPFLYALDERGVDLGRVEVSGAEAIDWEDIATGPGPRAGRSYLYVGDIGDNEETRSEIVVYLVEEPDPAAGVTAADAVRALRFTYPDRPHDAEALLVHPLTGDLYIVTKTFSGRANVYVARSPLKSETTLRLLHRLRVPTAIGGITAGDISPSGDRLVLATYTGALEFSLPPDPTGSFDAIWEETPREIPIGGRIQGEAIAYTADGLALMTLSEGVRSPIQKLIARGEN